jgi:hypothetical protein
MTNISGCAGYRSIPRDSLSGYSGYSHIVYGKKSKYILDSTVVSDGIFLGVIDSDRSGVKNAIKVYPSSYSSIKINKINTLTLPIDQIKLVEAPRIYKPKET